MAEEETPISSLCAAVHLMSAELTALVDRDEAPPVPPVRGGNVLIDRIASRQLSMGASSSTHHLAKKLKHCMLHELVSAADLEAIFPAMKANWRPADLTYNRYSRWNISSYCEVDQNWTPQTPPHPPLLSVMQQTLAAVKQHFAAWYCDKFGLVGVDVVTLNSFVTRYSALPEQDQLDKHVDGRRVDGSAILALPTDAPYSGGELTVWDTKAKHKYLYQLTPGDALFLDTMVWHQAHPIANGNKWSLVCFYKCKWGKPRLDGDGKKLPPSAAALAVRTRAEQNASAAFERAARHYGSVESGSAASAATGGAGRVLERPSRVYDAATRRAVAALGEATSLARHHMDDIVEVFAELHIAHGEVVLARHAFSHAMRELRRGTEVDPALAAQNEALLFAALDVDAGGTLDYDELVSGIALLCGGDIVEKAETLVAVLDPESTGVVAETVAVRCLEVQLRVLHACDARRGSTPVAATTLARTILAETLREWAGPAALASSSSAAAVSSAQMAHCIATVHRYLTGRGAHAVAPTVASTTTTSSAATIASTAAASPIEVLRSRLGLHEHPVHVILEDIAAACDEAGLVSHAAFAHVLAPFVHDEGSAATARCVEQLWTHFIEDGASGDAEGVDFQTLVSGILPLLGGSTTEKAARMFEIHDVNENYLLERSELEHFIRSALRLADRLRPPAAPAQRTSVASVVAVMLARALGDAPHLDCEASTMWFHSHETEFSAVVHVATAEIKLYH